MKKIKAEDLKPGDIFLKGGTVRIVVNMAAANTIRFMHMDGDVMDSLDPRTYYSDDELYLIATLKDIGEIIKESFDA